VSRSPPSAANRVRGSGVGTLALALLISCANAARAEAPPGASSCSGCHATSVKADTPVPPIFGRKSGEIIAAMQAFRTGERPSTIMGRIAKGFSDDEICAIAVWLAAQREVR
jgi:sulfide dehydrogenase cytochrome subunit